MLDFKPTKYTLNPIWQEKIGFSATIEFRSENEFGQRIFCVKVGQNVLTKDGELEYEASSSSRSNKFIKETRFTLDEAFKLAQKYVPGYLTEHVNSPLTKQFVLRFSDEAWAKEIIENYMTA